MTPARVVDGYELTLRAARLLSVKPLTAASALAAVLVLAGCVGANLAAESSASPPSRPAAASSPAAAPWRHQGRL
jgi:hypothetical protein